VYGELVALISFALYVFSVRWKWRKGDDKTKKSQQSGRLVNEDGEINTGRMDAMMNPLFLNTDSPNKSGGGSGGNAGAIAQMNAPPPAELWQVFRQEYIDMQRLLSSAGNGNGNASSPTTIESSNEFPSKVSVSKKKGFAPVTTGS